MSAFLLSAQEINQIVAGISCLANDEVREGNRYIPGKFAKAGFDINQAGWEEKLANAMFALNAQAVAQRYCESEAKGFTYTRVPCLPDPNVYQLLKSTNCWLYQCSEGDVPQRPLYRFFENGVVRWLLERIVYDSPQYEAAEWG